METPSTQFAVGRDGRFAVVTNFRYEFPRTKLKSRGLIPYSFVTSKKSPEEYLVELSSHNGDYDGYNVICGTPGDVWYFSNEDSSNRPKKITDNIRGCSNNFLGEWEKVRKGERLLGKLQSTDVDDFFAILHNEERVPDELVQETKWGLEVERLMAPIFVAPFDALPQRSFGTRAQYVLMISDDDHATLHERFRNDDGTLSSQTFNFDLEISS